MKRLCIRDKENKVLVEVNESSCLIHRYVDMDEQTKKEIGDLFFEATGTDRTKIDKFLNFESDEQEFCS